MGTCFGCGTAFDSDVKIFRSTTCPACLKDAHVCLNCRFYDTSAHMDCREPIAEPVTEKDRSNFCDYFKLREGTAVTGPANSDKINRARDTLDKLFDAP